MKEGVWALSWPPQRRKLAGLKPDRVIQEVETGEERMDCVMLLAGQGCPQRGGLQTCNCFSFLINMGILKLNKWPVRRHN